MITGVRNPDLIAKMSRGPHTLISGVDAKLGGQDEGFNPHELFEAALTACTIITVQMYANRKQWPLEATHVTVKILSEGKDASVISRDIQFVGPLNDEQRQRLLEIAHKCPLHSLMQSHITIQTQLVTT